MLLWVSQMALVAKNLPANARDVRDAGSIPGLGRSLGEGNGNPLQYSCLENPVARGAWLATVHGIAESDTTELKQARMHTHTHTHTHTHSALEELFLHGGCPCVTCMSLVILV